MSAPRKWAVLKRFEVPQFDGDGNYLTRWRIIETPWAGLYLHRFDAPDSRPTLHDHPWNFTSLILRGGYVERRLNPHDQSVDEHHRVRLVNRVRASEAHAIMRLLRTPSWSLVVVGRRVRQWGYLDPNPGRAGWVWTPFDKHEHNDEFMAALARRDARAAASGVAVGEQP